MDIKFWIPLTLTVVGVGFQAWQVWLMNKQIATIPSSRSPKRIQVEKQFLRKLYRPVFLMIVLVLLGWMPYVVEALKPAPIPVFLVGWSGAMDGCNAAFDTSPFVKLKDKYRIFLVCRIVDASIDPMEDEKIAISKPFQITGGIVSIVIAYGPNASIRSVAQVGTQTSVNAIVLPADRDGTNIKRLSDVEKEGGQVLITGGKLKF